MSVLLSTQRPLTHEAASRRKCRIKKPHTSQFSRKLLKSDLQLMESASNLAIMANQKRLITFLDPFDESSMMQQAENNTLKHHHTEATVESDNIRLTPLHSPQRSRLDFWRVASQQLSQIISKRSQRSKQSKRWFRNKEPTPRFKTEEQALGEEYIEDVKEAQLHQEKIRHQIEQKVAQVYPHRVRLQNVGRKCFLTDMFEEDQSKVQRPYREVQDRRDKRPALRSLGLRQQTTFYSRSKRKCMLIDGGAKASSKKAQSQSTSEKIDTYVDYLTASRPHKQRIVEGYRQKGSASASRKCKNKILKICREGSRQQIQLERCFDELNW